MFEKISDALLLFGLPLIKFSIFLEESCKKIGAVAEFLK